MNILNTYNEFNTNNFDLNVDHYGAEICAKNYSFGPTVRDNYVLHFIVDGKGKFTIDGITTQLKTGDMFILPKGKVAFTKPMVSILGLISGLALAGQKLKIF